MTLAAISPAAARALAERGEVTLIDLRPPAAFARGHPAGALAVPFSPRGLAARVRVALSSDSAVLLIAPDAATGEAAATQLRKAGMVARGLLEGGFEAWQAAGLPATVVREVEIDELPRLADVATVIDVREPLEWTTGHVPGALLVPLGRLRDGVASIPRDRAVIAICEAGIRSSTAASILGAAGFADVAHVPVGSAGYRRSGLPLAFPSEEVLAR
jgi:hydroxyacylglutathione hydrolase